MIVKKLYILFILIFFIGCAGKSAGLEATALSFTELQQLIQTKAEDYILIDVRTQAEYISGHIPTAILIPYDVITQQLPTNNKDELIIVYCRSGRRSSIAYNALMELGYTNLLDFGGVSNWQAELNKEKNP